MEDINKIIGRNLLQLRKNAKLTQLELAEKFNYSDKSISKWEAGESLPSIEILYNLCNFYGVTLNTLTQEEMQLNVPQRKSSISSKFLPNLPVRLTITLLAVSAVWMIATVLFVTFQLTIGKNIGIFYLWAVPITCIVLLIFNCVWGRSSLLFYILSILVWTVLACIHVQLLKYNIWQIYLLGIPLQVAIILWATLIKKQHRTPKVKKVKEEKPKREKKKKTKNATILEPSVQSAQKAETDEDFGFDFINDKKK